MRLAAVSCALAATVAPIVASPAFACGGCFSPPTQDTAQTVVQNSERVLFFRDEATKTAHVWIEVVYAGLAKDFGWVLPLPKVPKVATGTKFAFDSLDARLQFRVAVQQAAAENCRDPYSGCEAEAKRAGPAVDSGTSAGAALDVWTAPPPKVEGVDVLASGFTGPYEFAVIKGTEADKLFEWLTKAGYATPEKAKPVLQIHATKGDVFLAIKLQNGQGINAIKPVSLEMADAEPCVPLRLTAIAAQQDMTVAVTLFGASRAVVKNYFDVVVNPLRLTLLDQQAKAACPPEAQPGSQCHVPKNYGQVAAAAIDEAAGHAFVTEASLAGSALGQFAPVLKLNIDALKNAKTLLDFANWLAQNDVPLEGEVMTALQGAFMNAGPMFMQATQAQVFGTLKVCAKYWNQPNSEDACVAKDLTLSKAKIQAVQMQGEPLAKSFKEGIIDPLFTVGEFAAKAPRVTRLMMKISPEEMDRDPVFAFSPTLPEVKPVWHVQQNLVCTEGWSNGETRIRMSVDGIGSYLVGETSIIDPLFVKSPAALVVSVQEEAGPPIPVGSGDIGVVDSAIASAKPGTPSIPSGLQLKPYTQFAPPPSAKAVTKVGNWKKPPNCTPKKGWEDGQPPPKGETPDASSSGSDAGSAPDVTANLDASGSTGTGTTGKTGGGSGGSSCTAGGANVASLWMALLALVALGWRRRAT